MLNENSKDSFECNIEDEATPAPSTLSPTTQPPTTLSPTTQSHVISTEGPTGDPHVKGVIDGLAVGCYKCGYNSHPTDRHKYIVCEYIAGGPKQGWIHIMAAVLEPDDISQSKIVFRMNFNQCFLI
jgi:hypothetical protein